MVQEEEKTVQIFGRSIKQSDLIKLLGLIAFILIIAAIVAALWPSLSSIFEEGGVERLIKDIQDKGPLGVLMLLGLQFLQIIVAFIPGEVVQIAAGMLYGPVLGTVIIMAGCIISSALIYLLVHRLGMPFVQAMVSEDHLKKFRAFEESGKLTFIVFILFFIPAFPKDALTYIVPLSNMKLSTFLIVSTCGRFPAAFVSIYAASGLAKGDITGSVVIFIILGIIALLALVFSSRIMNFLNERK